MIKTFFKYFSFTLATFILCFSITHASEEDYVSVNVYNNIFYGTLSPDNSSDDENIMSFSTLESCETPFTISGIWKKDAFSGDCTITYDNGVIQNVTYKKGLISGEVTSMNPDGTYQVYSCKSGNSYGALRIFSQNNDLIDIDYFYLNNPTQDWVSASVSVDYNTLFSNPYDYVDLPITISGIVSAIYETIEHTYLKVCDSAGNPYIFKYRNPSPSKFAQTTIGNLSVGDAVTITGIFSGVHNGAKDPLTLYAHSSPIQTSYSDIKRYIADNDLLDTIKSKRSVPDSDLDKPFLEFNAITCQKDNEAFSPIQLNGTYEEMYTFPYLYQNTDITLTGTVVDELYDYDDEMQRIFLQSQESSDIYVISYEMSEVSAEEAPSLIGTTLTCSGILDGDYKFAYYDSDAKYITYISYPNLLASS